MYIKKIKVHNFRLLKDFSIDLEKELSLIIGKNNTGKTSLLQLLDKMLNNGENKIQYYDLNLDYRKSLVDDISVPLKSGQININQTIPEKGKN